jgi:hypothetical protein
MEMSAGEMQAAATGNMDLLKEIQLRTDVKKLEQAKRSFDATRNDLVSRRRRADEAVATLPAKIARAEKMAEASKAYTDAQKAQAERFSVTINGKTYTDAREAGAVLQAFVDAKQFTKKGTDIVLTPEQYQAMDEDERSASNGWQERPVPLKVEMDGKTYTARAALGEAFADLRGDVNDAPLWQVDGQTYIRRTKAAAAIAQRVADSMAEMTEAEVGRIGPFTVTVEGQPPSAYAKGTTGLEVVIRAPGGVEASTTLNFKDIASEDDARKAATGVINAAMSLASGGQQQVLWLRSDLERQQRVLADLATAKVAAEFPQQDKLEAARAAHKEVLARLAAKPEQPAAPEADEAGDTALSRRTMGEPTPAMRALEEADDIFALPRLNGKTVSEIAFDLDPTIKVTSLPKDKGRERWRVTLANGAYGDISIRQPNRFGPNVYGFDLNDEGESANVVTERPGVNPEDVDPSTEDVWIDVSQMKTGQGGAQVYAIAGALAHNTGRMFIGDPNGLSKTALRRRAENMLSLALRYGTTDFLAPHPDQIKGDAANGVPPLRWVYGDDEGNAERLIALNLQAVQNAFPALEKIDFDADTGEFRNVESGRVITRSGLERVVADRRAGVAQRLAGTGVAGNAGVQSALDTAAAGGRTVARAAVLRSLAREASSAGAGAGRRDGVLARLARLAGQNRPSLKGLFSRGAGRGVAMADAEAARDALLRAMPKAPRITLLERVDQAPASLLSKISSAGASADVEGAFHEGEVFIFPGNIDSLERLQFVMAHHELRHYGLRSLMPNQNRRGPLLLAIYNTNPEIRRQADDKMAAGLAGSKVLAVEEALADMPVEQMQALKGGPRLLAALRDVLRKLAEVFRSLGWVRVADALEPATWTDADVVALVRRAEAVSRTGGPLFRVGDTAFSRSPSVATKALTAALSKPGAALRDVRLPAGYVVGDWFGNSLGRLHWWHKTVGTPYNLAERERSFRPVFESIQNFMDDISHYATEAANLAPSILPKLESITDILKAPLPPADVKALAAPVFEGTLGWGRDLDGKPVRMVDLEAKAAQLSAEDKAQEMLRRRLLNPRVLKMWQGLPLEQFEAAVETRYQNEVLKPGVVWSDGELRTMFGLSPRQIALYREFRSATDKSLDDLTITTMLRVGGEEVADLREQVLAEPDLMTAAELIRDRLFDLAEQQPENADAMNARGNGIIDIADRVEDLKDRGYAPLSRFGQYTLDVVTPDGVRQFFGMYESRSERAKAVRLMRENFPDADIKQGTTSEEEFKLFAGVTPETLELFGDKLGLSDEVAKSSLFQKWLQVAKANRSGMKRLIHRKGVPGFSEDVGRVLASFIYSNARQASSNLHAGAAERAIEEIPQSKGQLKDYAVRLNEYVKNPQEEAQALRSVLFAQFLGGSIASAIVNATQPFMVTLPYLTQFGGVGKAGARMAAALKDVGRREFPKDKGLTEALNRAAEDGIVAPQEVFFLQAQASGKAQLQSGDGTLLGNAGARVNNGISRLTLAWGKPFSFAELFNRRLTFIAAYRTAQEEGMSRPYEFAIKAVRETQFLYNKGNRPRWARGAVGALLFTFKTYSVSMVEHLARNAKTPQGRRALLAALVMIAMMAGLDGLPFMEDVEDVIDGVMQRVFDKNFSLRFERNQWIARQLIALVGEDLGQPVADFLAKGVTGLPGAPFDVSGRLGLHNIIPGTGVFLKKDSYARDVADVAGAAGSFVARMFDAIGKAAEGRMKEALVLASPIAVQNAVKGGMMAQTGMYPDTRENMVVKTTLADAGFKAAGFQPKVVQKAQQVAGESARAVALVRQVETEIVTAMAKALARSDPAGLREALERLDSWNRKNPGSPIRITPSQVRERLKSMTTEKSVRLLKSAPREMRPGLAERFQQLEPQE